MNLGDWAEDTARTMLQVPLPRRWAHTQGVAAQARSLAVILDNEADLVTAAAWLHDIGYGPDVHGTGFHPFDGARYLVTGWEPGTWFVGWSHIIRWPSSRQKSGVWPTSWPASSPRTQPPSRRADLLRHGYRTGWPAHAR